MKKIFNFPIILILLFSVFQCRGYEPIFSTSNMQFEIAEYSLDGNKRIAKQIYSNLNNLTKSNDEGDVKSIYLEIKVIKEKTPTSKNSAGKILEYRINLNTDVLVLDYLTKNTLMNQNFNSSFSYKVQDQYSETIKMEDKALNNLINKTYKDLLLKLTEKIH